MLAADTEMDIIFIMDANRQPSDP